MQKLRKLELDAGPLLLAAGVHSNAGLSTTVSKGIGLDINTIQGINSMQNLPVGFHLTDPDDIKANVVRFIKKILPGVAVRDPAIGERVTTSEPRISNILTISDESVVPIMWHRMKQEKVKGKKLSSRSALD
jgi:hypothetical protein